MVVVMHPPGASWVAFVTLCLGDCIYAGAHGCETSIVLHKFLLTIAAIRSDIQERGSVT